MKTVILNDSFKFDGHELVNVTTGEVIKLDFRLAKLLAFLVQNHNTLISRDTLIAEVWDGTIVNDNTITWSISQLRKHLGDDIKAPQYIETKPKKGYVFLARLTEYEASKTPVSVEKAKRSIALPICILIVVVIASSLILYSPDVDRHDNWRITNVQSLTVMDGRETSPLVSSDTSRMYFLHRMTTSDRYQINYSQLRESRTVRETQSDGTSREKPGRRSMNPYPVVDDEYHYMHMVWQKTDESIIASRRISSADGTSCEIVAIVLNDKGNGVESIVKLHDCLASHRVYLAFDDRNQTLYFTQSNDGSVHTLHKLHMTSNQVSEISNYEYDGMGDVFVSMDLKQEKLLILRDIQGRQTEFLIYTIADQSFSEVLTLDSVYYSAHLDPEGQAIWLNWGNDLILSYDLESRESYQLLKTHIGWNYNLNPINSSQAVMETSDGNEFDIVYFSQGKQVDLSSTTNEFIPRLSNGGLIYVAVKQGLPQIWLKSGEQAARQLTTLSQYREFADLAISSDGRFICAVNNQQVGMMDLVTQEFRLLTDDTHYARNLRLSETGLLYFTSYSEGIWRGFVIDLSASVPTVLNLALSQPVTIQPLPDGKLLYTKADSPGLYTSDSDGQSEAQILPEFNAQIYWRYADGYLYFINELPERGLYRTPMNRWQPELVTKLEPSMGGRFDVADSGNRIIFERTNRDQTNIAIASISNSDSN